MKHFRITLWLVCMLWGSGASAHAAGLPSGRLLYCGETPNGWQVFQLDLPDGKPKQLTFSAGDKREPSVVSGVSGRVVYRDGGILSEVEGTHSERGFASGEIDWAGYTFFPGGSRLLVTRLVGQRARRQHVFSYDLATKKEAPFAMAPRGSYGNVRLSPDGSRLALTHVVTYGSERLALLTVTEPDVLTYLTPDNSMAEYPRWSGDAQKIYCAYQPQDASSMQIHEIAVATGRISALPLGVAAKTTAPFPTPDDQGVFFQIGKDGKSTLAYWSRQTGRVIELDLGRSAAEPFYFIP
jgi:hypothetical protein